MTKGSVLPDQSLRKNLPAARLATLFLSVLLLAAPALSGCGGKDGPPEEKPADSKAASSGKQEASPAGDRRQTKVETMLIQPRDLAVVNIYIGNLKPADRVELRSELEGVVEKLDFEESQKVGSGEILANISTSTQQVQRDLAESDFQLADTKYKRDQELFKKKLISSSQLDESRNIRQRAFFNLQLARINLNKSILKTPINGVVKTRAVSRGEFVNKGQLIAEVLDTSRLQASISVPEREISLLKAGMAVEISLDALPGKTFPGHVLTIGLEADVRSRTFPVDVELENQQELLRPGMLARVRIELEKHSGQVLIPRHAVVERVDARIVFVVENGQAWQRTISLGSGNENEVQITGGLKFGDRLVVTGHQRLSDGDPVQVHRELAVEEQPSGQPQEGETPSETR